jgi:hypothetical protein
MHGGGGRDRLSEGRLSAGRPGRTGTPSGGHGNIRIRSPAVNALSTRLCEGQSVPLARRLRPFDGISPVLYGSFINIHGGSGTT